MQRPTLSNMDKQNILRRGTLQELKGWALKNPRVGFTKADLDRAETTDMVNWIRSQIGGFVDRTHS